MELLLRISAVALLAAAVCLLLRRNNSGIVIPLSAAVCAFAMFTAAGALQPVLDALQQAKTLSGLSEAYFLPVIKCVVIGILAKGAADLCRDSGQSAMAGAVEFGGAAAALYVALPLLQTLLGFLEKLL